MNIQEQEERDFHRMSPYEFEAAAVEWMAQINDTFNTSFTLEEFE